ncbi:related to ABC transporter [Cephalotrichum gorgonifer]|uniref:Related to ABC transporter n=1 Tax=Cephalotrichum gorgonifer TaxID=2041049 RepID=A0AAE8N0J8_9PEZI|nr:related to ABC transporter [Cephalotrichum gorgonifer]
MADAQIEKHDEEKVRSSELTRTPTTTEPAPELKEEEDEEDGGNGYLRIFRYAGTFEYTLQGVAVLAAIASGAGNALQNLIFGAFITTITDFASGKSEKGAFMDEVGELALYFVYLGIGRAVLAFTYNTLFTYAATRIVRNIRHEYLRSALSQEVAYYDFGTGGSIATQATSNGKLIQAGIAEKLGLAFQGISAFVTAFIIAFVVQWKLTLICLCIAPAILIVMGITAPIQAMNETKMLEIFAQANSFAEGVIASVRTVQAFEMRARLAKKFDGFLEDAHTVGKKNSVLFGIFFSAEYTIIYLGFGLAFWQGIRMLSREEITSSGQIFTVILSVVIGSISLTSLAPYSIDFVRAGSSAAQLFKLIDRESNINPFDEAGEQPTDTVGHIELENVTFAYPTRPGVTVLDNFSLTAPPGKVTALVGQSGSGKSTIVGLIERWYNPKSGSIKLDGRPINELNLNWLRKNVRLVQQEPVLFRGSVFDNIRHGLIGTEWENSPHEEQMKRVREAATLAFAHDFIMELPDGYDTSVGERGGLLSGGQKQRVAIARSIISQPKVLLLDEATSALDPQAEAIVQQALDKAAEGRTTIVIAHKLATIQKADNIVVMKQGRIVEHGTHESLVEQDGMYARLVRIQNLSVSEASSETGVDLGGDATADDGGPADLTKTLTRYPSSVQGRMESQMDRDNYDKHNHVGILTAVYRLFMETPELRLAYFWVFMSCLTGGALFPAQAILLANVMDVFTLTGSEMTDRGSFYASMFIVLAAGCLVIYFILGYSTNVVAQQLNHILRKNLFVHVLRQDVQFLDRKENDTGALASRIDSDPQSVFELMGYNIGLVFIAVVQVTASGILAIAHNWNLGLVIVLAGLPPMLTAGWLKVRSDVKLNQHISKRYETSASIASEAIAAMRTVSSLAIEKSVLEKYTAELDEALSGSTMRLFRTMTWFALTQAIEYWFMALGFWYGCKLLSKGDVSMYNFFVAFLGIVKGVNAANYYFWLKELQPTVQETDENRENGPKSGGPIELNSVRFSYPLRPDTTVLKGIDMSIKKGQFVAFVGASGCGKSTMIAMLERFYDPTTGNITIDSSALTDLNPRLYRGIVALIQQEPVLFQGTIRENVSLGVDDPNGSSTTPVSDAEIEAALRSSNAWDFVSSLPEGLATLAGSNGTQLSGGQRQRIAIARALIRNPKVLLLDEATSALDTESEKMVQAALSEAAKEGDRITVAVAHRLSTIRDADMIFVFRGGRIAEAGTHAELIANGDGMYRKMCEAQALD